MKKFILVEIVREGGGRVPTSQSGETSLLFSELSFNPTTSLSCAVCYAPKVIYGIDQGQNCLYVLIMRWNGLQFYWWQNLATQVLVF